MRKFFITPDDRLLEIDSPYSLTKTNLKEYPVKTSTDATAEYMPVITKNEFGYTIKVNEPCCSCEEPACNECEEKCCSEKEECCESSCEESSCSSDSAEECEGCCNRVIFIELDVDGLRMKRYLGDHEHPEVTFHIPHGKIAVAYAYSTKGGLWMSTLKDDEDK